MGHQGHDDRAAFEEQLRARLVAIYSANPWLIGSEVEQGAVRQAVDIRAIGGRSVLAVGARPGVGELDPAIPLVSLNLPDEGTMVANIHSASRSMLDPPGEVQQQIDDWDPEGAARSFGALTAVKGTYLGRPTFGARPQSWLELEDKLAIEALWTAAGIPLAPSTQVAVADEDELIGAHQDLATELGTVWAGDNSDGWHGGGEGTFWVPDLAAAQAMPARLARFDRVRIMPFLEGVPCSIHGMVLPTETGREYPQTGADAVATFRPCEMMMMRDHDAGNLVYGRASSFWEPTPADRVAMQDTARRVGAELRRAVGYRGVFTVDGIMTADGFRPSEVNTRYGAALASRMETLSGDPLELFHIHMALVEGVLDDVDLDPLQRWATANLDAAPRAVGFLATSAGPEIERTATIRRTAAGALHVEEPAIDGPDRGDDDDAHDGEIIASVRWGSAPTGGLLIVEAKSGFPAGPPTAPLLIRIIEALDTTWSLGAPRLVAARNVR